MFITPASGAGSGARPDDFALPYYRSRVVRSQHALDRVDQARADLRARDWGPDARKYAYGIGYHARSDTILVETNAPPSVVEPIKSEYEGLVEFQFTDISRQTRFSDIAPHWGAARISPDPGSNTWCTSPSV